MGARGHVPPTPGDGQVSLWPQAPPGLAVPLSSLKLLEEPLLGVARALGAALRPASPLSASSSAQLLGVRLSGVFCAPVGSVYHWACSGGPSTRTGAQPPSEVEFLHVFAPTVPPGHPGMADRVKPSPSSSLQRFREPVMCSCWSDSPGWGLRRARLAQPPSAALCPPGPSRPAGGPADASCAAWGACAGTGRRVGFCSTSESRCPRACCPRACGCVRIYPDSIEGRRQANRDKDFPLGHQSDVGKLEFLPFSV